MAWSELRPASVRAVKTTVASLILAAAAACSGSTTPTPPGVAWAYPSIPAASGGVSKITTSYFVRRSVTRCVSAGLVSSSGLRRRGLPLGITLSFS